MVSNVSIGCPGRAFVESGGLAYVVLKLHSGLWCEGVYGPACVCTRKRKKREEEKGEGEEEKGNGEGSAGLRLCMSSCEKKTFSEKTGSGGRGESERRVGASKRMHVFAHVLR